MRVAAQRDRSTVDPEIISENYSYLQAFIYRESGIVLEAGKQHLLETRLHGILREYEVPTVDDFCALLRSSHSLSIRQKVIDAMTTNETYFFREPEHFDILASIILPELIHSRRAQRRLRFWSAATSTGQEAYSLAMTLCEVGLTENHWDIQILATDLNSRVLDRARSGIFSRLEMTRGLPASCAAKYFNAIGPQWQANGELQRMIRFQPFDLRASMHDLGPFEIVFCRNVLIYFDLPTKLAIINAIHPTLIPGGHLFLGSTESDLPVSARFRRKSIGGATVFVAR
jgi:chemotaxis protein methyltransferase CheR